MKIPALLRPWPRLPAIVLLAVVALGVTGVTLAQSRGQRTQAVRDHRSEDRQADHRALADAVRRVERASGGGEVLSAERVQSDGRDVSRVKVVDASGRVRVYMDDTRPRERSGDRTRRDDSKND